MNVRAWLDSVKKKWMRQGSGESLSSPNLETKIKQKKQLGILVIIAVALVILIAAFHHPKPANDLDKKSKVVKAVKESAFTSPVDGVDENSIWLARAENKLSNEQKNTNDLQKMVQKQQAAFTSQSSKVDEQEDMIDNLNQKITDLQHQLTTLATKAPQNNTVEQGSSEPLITGMSMTTLSLTPSPAASMPVIKTPDTYAPSGSYAKAILLGGLEASAGVNAQSNPRPVLLRVLDNGILPNGFHSHLKNCRILGAGYGDISSERAYIRLESMSCWDSDKLVDFPVYGYISGADGKDGVRGRVVMRDGELITKGFIGGALSGFGDSVSDNYTETSISPLGSTTSVKNGENLEYGAAQGVSNAADLYAQYNIKRAEQLQPVIEISAGSVVDVVFTKGFYLDGLSEKEHRQNNTSSTPVAPSYNTINPSVDTMNNANLTAQVQQITGQPLPAGDNIPAPASSNSPQEYP